MIMLPYNAFQTWASKYLSYACFVIKHSVKGNICENKTVAHVQHDRHPCHLKYVQSDLQV